MLYLIIALAALGIISAIFGLLSHNKEGGNDVIVKKGQDCGSCDGNNEKCEQTCMMEAATKPIEYFDDEELDRFSGRQSGRYSDEEAEAFREVLYTMAQSEVKDWTRSLTLRGISLPDQVKDEAFLLMNGD
ncbi:MAG: hypothetical protein K5893_08455 [Prevotella sp.]|nr:hypothetical protein [Prevotella sp.]